MYSGFTEKELDHYRPLLLTRDGYFCNVCHRSVSDLIKLADAYAIIKQKERKHPVLTIDHRNGNERIRDGPNGEFCGNLQLACYSCNNIKSPEQEPLPLTLISREKQDSTKGEAAFHRNLKTFLLDNEHICSAEIGTSAKNFSNKIIKETAGLRYFHSERITPSNPKGLYQDFPYDCGAEYCKGTHYCLKGCKPEKLIEIEAQRLLNQYNEKYHNGDEKHYRQFETSWGQPFILFDEFYNQHAIIGRHNFV